MAYLKLELEEASVPRVVWPRKRLEAGPFRD